MPSGTKKTSISLRPDLIDWAEQRASELGFEHSFSAYVAWLIKRDQEAITGRPDQLREPSTHYGARPLAKRKGKT